MRGMVLIFSGKSEADEKRVSDIFQSVIYKLMDENGMSVRYFNNEQIDGDRVPVLMLTEQMPQELKVPEFMEAPKRRKLL